MMNSVWARFEMASVAFNIEHFVVFIEYTLHILKDLINFLKPTL
jgi:hypothetical protein